jgi:hypothetical protein
MLRRKPLFPYGKQFYHIDEIKPGKGGVVGSKLYYGQVGMLYLANGGPFIEDMDEEVIADLEEVFAEGDMDLVEEALSLLEKAKSKRVVDKPGGKQDKYEYKGKVGVWRTIAGKRYFFPDDGSGSIPPMSSKVKKKLGKDAEKAKKKAAKARKKEKVSGLKTQIALAKAGGMKAKAKRLKGKLKATKKGDVGALKSMQRAEKESAGVAAEKKMLPKIRAMIKKAMQKGNRAVVSVLKKMEAAIKKGDGNAFKKAAAQLPRVIAQTRKKVEKTKGKAAKAKAKAERKGK